MKKLGIISIILSLLLVFFVLGDDIFTFDISNLPGSGDPGATVSGDFTIRNDHIEDVDNIVITIVEDLDGPVNVAGTAQTLPASSIIISPNTLTLLAAGATSDDITFTLVIPGQQYAGTYTGTINASNVTHESTEDFSFDVNQVVGMSLGSEIDSSNIFLMSGSDDSTFSRSFTLTNTGNVDITNYQITIDEEVVGSMSDGSKVVGLKVKAGSGSYQSVTFGTPINLGAMVVGSNTITIEATIPNNMDVDTYEGNVTLASTNSGFSGADQNFELNVRIEPEICEDGRMSNGVAVGSANTGWIKIKIDEPDNGDDFEQGDEIDIDVTVDNDGTQDLDIVVEAILYDLDEDEEVTSIKSDDVEIEEGKDEDFSLTLTIPYDENLDDSNTYFLYVKSYEDGDEDKNCNYDSVELDFKRKSHKVIIDGFTINPSVVSPGQLVSFVVDVLNVGEKDEDDVYIKVYNAELGLNEESIKFDLDKYDKSGNDETKTISFTIPSDASAKDYAIEAIVYYDDGDESYSVIGTLTVSGPVTLTTLGDGVSGLSLPQTSISATAGKVFAIPFTVNNDGDSSITYSVGVSAVGAWADSVTETITVEAGSSNTGYAYLTPYSSTASGSYSATVTLKQDGNNLDSKTISVNIVKDSGVTGAVTYQPASVLGDLTGSTWFWIIGNVILVILVILILFLIFRKR